MQKEVMAIGLAATDSTKRLFTLGETSQQSGISYLSEISAEWWISLYKNKSFTWTWIHLTQGRAHLNADEIPLRLDGFSPCKQYFPGRPTQARLLFSLTSVCFCNFKAICSTMFNVFKRILYYNIKFNSIQK